MVCHTVIMVRGIFELVLAVLLVFVLFLSNPSRTDFVNAYLLPRVSLGQPSARGRSIVIQPLRPENADNNNDGSGGNGIGAINDFAQDVGETARDVIDDALSRVEGADPDFVRGVAANVLQGQTPIERRTLGIASIFTVPRAGRDILVLGIADRFITISE